MNNIKYLLDSLCEAARHPQKTVLLSMEQTGRKAIGCFPLYTPDELIYAAGFLPVGLWGGRTHPQLCGRYLQSFCCSVMRGNLEQGLRGDYSMLSAVVIPTYCDTLKCIEENWRAAIAKPVAIPMVYPQNRKSAAGEDFLTEEFQRVTAEIALISGRPITEQALQSSFVVYESYRAAMREFTCLASLHPLLITPKIRHLVIKAGFFMEKSAYTLQIEQINALLASTEPQAFSGKRVVVTGIMLDSEELLDVLEQNSIVIVADDLAQESRQFRTASPDAKSVYRRMAKRFAAQNGDPLLYDPDKSRGAQLIKLVRQSDADGVLISMMKFCDPEEFDYPIYKKELEKTQIPMLYLELEQSEYSAENFKTRTEGFVEMLDGR